MPSEPIVLLNSNRFLGLPRGHKSVLLVVVQASNYKKEFAYLLGPFDVIVRVVSPVLELISETVDTR